jgi:dimeric dUTPase (all-alpha-NTP-PPase superfamily)
MENNITKSPEMLVREAKIKELQNVLKKRKSVLKSLKTRLGSTKNEIEDTQRNIQSLVFDKMSKMEALRVEIGQLAVKMKANKQFSKADKKALDEIASEFLEGSIFGEGFQEFQEKKRKMEEGDFDFDEDFRAKFNDVFEEFKVKPKEEEQRDIRKVFIKLSRKFHPDLADNDAQAEEFHSIMQQINEAYKNNDIQILLEMEQLYLTEEFDLMSNSLTVDVLQQEIERLERDINFINNQVDRTSLEIKQLRDSNMGSMLSSVKKANREGEGLKEMEAEMQRGIDLLEQIKFGFSDSLERGSISPVLMQMMNPFSGLFGGGMTMFDDDDDDDIFGNLFSMMMEDEDDDYEEIENPTFPIESAVKVKTNLSHKLDKKIKMKGWVGRVEEAFYNENEQAIYRVSFDSLTLQAMPKSLLQKAYNKKENLFMYDFLEHQLEATAERDTEDEAIATHRTLKVTTEWENMVKGEDLILAKSILLADPTKDDEENWKDYLENCMPFNAQGKGYFKLKTNKEVTVKEIYGWNMDTGLTVLIQEEKSKKKPYEYPLFDLLPKENKMEKVVKLYEMWLEEIFEKEDDDDFFF